MVLQSHSLGEVRRNPSIKKIQTTHIFLTFTGVQTFSVSQSKKSKYNIVCEDFGVLISQNLNKIRGKEHSTKAKCQKLMQKNMVKILQISKENI